NSQVVIGLESADFDAWVTLYQDDGTEVGFDDDGGEGFNSSLPADLTGGVCYIVEASTAFEMQTGTYVLTVSPAT
ncbi:MAG: peptidase, partial [Gemmatimonadetes bacterium]|nr:peptidase [Gemmatimonadota bacterium]